MVPLGFLNHQHWLRPVFFFSKNIPTRLDEFCLSFQCFQEGDPCLQAVIQLHPPKTNGWNRKLGDLGPCFSFSKRVFFPFHVSFRGCISWRYQPFGTVGNHGWQLFQLHFSSYNRRSSSSICWLSRSLAYFEGVWRGWIFETNKFFSMELWSYYPTTPNYVIFCSTTSGHCDFEMCSFIVNLPRKRQPAWHMPTSSTRWRLKVQKTQFCFENVQMQPKHWDEFLLQQNVYGCFRK